MKREAALPRSGYLLLAGITLFWGTNWPAMKIVLEELPVWWFRSLCLIVGGVGLLTIARLSGQRLSVPSAEIPKILLCAVFNVVAWHLFSAYGVSLMPAGRAVIVAFTMPVWAALLGSLLLDEALTRRKLAALGLGLGGLATLIGPDLVVLGRAPLGAFFMLMAAICWATGTVLLKRFHWTIPTSTLVGWQLIAGAVPITIGALLSGPPPDLFALSDAALISLFYVFAFPMLFCQWAYFKTVRLFPATIAAIGTLAIPPVGVYSSALVLGESVGGRELAALLLTCAALAAVLFPSAARPPAPA